MIIKEKSNEENTYWEMGNNLIEVKFKIDLNWFCRVRIDLITL